MRTPAPAQRTLRARRDGEATSAAGQTIRGTLDIAGLDSLFDRMRALPAGASRKKLYNEYGVDERLMEEVGRSVNSPSVGGEEVVKVVNGEEVREMKVSFSFSSWSPASLSRRLVSADRVPLRQCG